MNTNNTTYETRLHEAEKRAKKLRHFYQNLLTYIVVCSFLGILNWITSPHYWWVLWVILGWGIGIVSQVVSLNLWGNGWERRKVEQYMQNKQQ